jgi:hypothetical protein
MAQNKELKEFELIFSQLNILNKNYAIAILQSLYFAQEFSLKKYDSSDEEAGQETENKDIKDKEYN